MVAQASPELKKTVVKLLELSEDEETRMIYEAEVKALRDDRARMRGAFEKGVFQGRALGLAEGENKGRMAAIAEGLAEGENKGRHEKTLEIARNLIAMGMPIEKIIAATTLSCEEIEKVRAESTNVK